MRYDRLMGQRTTGRAVAVRGNLDGLLRRLLPLSLLVLTLNGLRFALEGAPGVDHVAHMRAIALPFGRLVGWIAGMPIPDLVPAPLRAAPLPLMVDWLVWRIVPFGMTGLRIVHLLLAVAAVWLLLRALAMRMDLRTAHLAGLAVALSPRFIEPVTSLGTTPFIIILFCVQLAMLLTRGKIGGPAPLALYGASAVASGLCGIPGMLAASSLLLVLLFCAPDWSEFRARARLVLIVVAVWAPWFAVLLRSGAYVEPMSLISLALIGIRLVAHNADFLLLPGTILLVCGTALLILLGTYSYVSRLVRYGLSERTHPFALLLLAVVIGTLLTVLAGPVLRLYMWTEPLAEAWLALLIILLATACFTPRLVSAVDSLRGLRFLGAIMMLAGALAGTISYQRRAEWFAAGPEAGLVRALEAAGTNRAIIYAGNDWRRAYYPHVWLVPDDDEQWLLAIDGKTVQRVLPGGQLGPEQPLRLVENYDTLVVVRIDRRNWRDLRALASAPRLGAMPPVPPDAFKTWLADPAVAAPGESWLTTQLLTKVS